jgi:hypothetical protein
MALGTIATITIKLGENSGNAGKIGAGEGNRTLVISLGSCFSTIEIHPHALISEGKAFGRQDGLIALQR